MKNDEEFQNEDIEGTSKTKKHLIYAAASAVAVLVIAAILGIFKASSTAEAIKIICDAFFAAGVLMGGVGILSWIGTSGSFDIFSYSAKVIGYKFKPKAHLENYYDYKQEKAKNRKPWLKELTICGAICILLAVVMLVIYNQI